MQLSTTEPGLIYLNGAILGRRKMHIDDPGSQAHMACDHLTQDLMLSENATGLPALGILCFAVCISQNSPLVLYCVEIESLK